MDQNLGLRGKHLVYIEFFLLLCDHVQFGAIRCFSEPNLTSLPPRERLTASVLSEAAASCCVIKLSTRALSVSEESRPSR